MRGKAFEETRLKIVREALSGVKIAVLARKYEIHPETIRNWVKDYREKVGDDEIPSTDDQIQELKTLYGRIVWVSVWSLLCSYYSLLKDY